ncbi:MAG: serine/threonine protein kinase [Myxococcales bacterium]|nr:serine/threonine protein kinase [Myxococcales bacterium]
MIDPSLIASRYRVLRELGRGGMGVVYVVEHVNTGDHLALKLLLAHANASPETVERFKREARAPAKIKSEHVVKVTDADVAPELDHAPFLVMELLDGQDLEKLVETYGMLPPDQVVDLLAQVARALDKAHAAGIVHRDLKPENLFLHKREGGSEIVKILDFGISKVMGGEGLGSTAQAGGGTKTGAVFGTPLYMAPEQAKGLQAQIGPCTDIWALGLIAYRLITGQIYWRANTVAELLVQIIAEPMAPPSSLRPFAIGPAFDAWFARSCDRDPALRFRTVGEQVRALAEALGVPVPAGLSAEASVAVPPVVASSPHGAPSVVQASAPHIGYAPTAQSPQVQAASGDDFNRSNASVYSTVSGSVGTKRSVLPFVAAGAVVLLLAIGGTVFAITRASATAAVEPSTAASADTALGAAPAVASPTAAPAPAPSPEAVVKPEDLPSSNDTKRPTTTAKPTSTKATADAGAAAATPAPPPPVADPPPTPKPAGKKPVHNPEAP